MSLSLFLLQLLDDHEIDSLELQIVQDNAKLDHKTRKAITPKREERLCRWSLTGKAEMPRLDSDPYLYKRSQTSYSSLKTVDSESSFLRLPQRKKSLQNSANASWNNACMLQKPERRKSIQNQGLVVPRRRISILNEAILDNKNSLALITEAETNSMPRQRRMSILNQCCVKEGAFLIMPQRRQSILNQGNRLRDTSSEKH